MHIPFAYPQKIAWVGNYAYDFPFYEEVWGENEGIVIRENQTKLTDKFLCNHTKKEYVNCNEYYKKSHTKDDWCLHPLPLLTCIGNGQGGGDYYADAGKDFVGLWCWDIVSVEDNAPEGYKEIDVMFKE